MSDVIEDSSKSKLYVDLVGALISGSLLAYEVLWHNSDGAYHYNDLVKYMLLAVGSYAAMAVLLHRIKRGKFTRKIPIWILIAILGSVILVSYAVMSHTIFIVTHSDGWGRGVQTPLPEKIFAELKHAALFFAMFTVIYSLLTLPIMAVVYYAGSLIQWIRR